MTSAIPDSATPYLGWRGWRLGYVDRDGCNIPTAGRTKRLPVLVAVVAGRGWVPRQALKAECFDARKHEEPPVLDCTCGIYSTSRMREVRQLLLRQRYEHNDAGSPVVIGRVAQFGRVVLHQEGARSQAAYPSELYVPSHWQGRSLEPEARELEEAYGVPVEILDNKMMTAFATDEWDVLRNLELITETRTWREVLGETA